MEITTYRLHQDQFNSIQNQLQPNLENGVVQSVDARKLYEWLGFDPTNFSSWMARQIDRAGLVEHEDYEILLVVHYEQDWGDVIVIEEFELRKTQQVKFNVKFNVRAEGFVLFIKEMKNFMIENKIGLAKSGHLPGIEW